MDLSSVRIAAGACAVFGGLALVGGGAVANAAPGAHSAASDSASAADSAAGPTSQARSGLGRSASNGGASSVITGPKGKPALDLTSVFGGQQSSVLPNSAAAVPNSAAATGPNSPSTASPSTTPSTPSGASQPGGISTPATGFGDAAAHTNTSGPLGSVERVVGSTWSVVDAVGNAIGAIVNGVGTLPSPVVKTPMDRAPSNGGAAVNGFLTGQPGFGNPGASALAAGRVTLTPSLSYSQLPMLGGNSVTGPISSAILTPDLVSAAESANAGSPPVISPIPVPGAKWLTDLPLQVRNALRTATTAELLMGALPGLLGLVAFFVAGVGLGRRQAKFGFAMESTDIMRFAAKGPLGVVRGSFIAVSAKRTPIVRSKSTAKLTLVDRVA